MLKLYIDKVPTQLESEVIDDVERAFGSIMLTGSADERRMLKIIEQAEYLDSQSFIDRFGFRLYINYMSTGCKAAMCALHYKDKIIDLVECGFNARDAIVNYCTDGSVLTRESRATFANLASSVSIVCEGREFSDLSDLNFYLQNER